MRVAYLAAGAGGMYCGSCLRDCHLAAALIAKGRDVTLVPLYTPLRHEEPDAGLPRVFYGGLNVYLQHKWGLFRRMPRLVDALLDSPRLLRSVGRLGRMTDAHAVGALTVSVLRGRHGRQRRELVKLIDGLRELRPDLVNLPNLLFAGAAGPIRDALGIPVCCTLAGEDAFLDRLSTSHRQEAIDLIRAGGEVIDAFVAPTSFYAGRAVAMFALPPERVHVVPLGIRASDFDFPPGRSARPVVIGHLARICQEKGLAELAVAFTALRRRGRDCRLHVAGYLHPNDRDYLARVSKTVDSQGAGQHFAYLGEVTKEQKLAFLRSIHVLSVPAAYDEAKGLYVLEALAAGVPVVQPNRGSFPELIEATGGGVLYDPGDSDALTNVLERLVLNHDLREQLGAAGQRAVRELYTVELMAERTWALYVKHVAHGIE